MHRHLHAGISYFLRGRWLLTLVGLIAVAILTRSFATILIVLGVVLMIMVHEFGHFLTAKLFGMKVTEYFLGFGPRLWSFFRGETEYGVKAIPAGGYVRIIGMNNLEVVDPADEPRTYRQQPFYQRIIVVCAGSFMHFVMAFLLLFSVYVFVGQAEASTKVASVNSVTTSPAAAAGLQKGDKLLAVNGVKTNSWTDVTDQLAKASIGVSIPVQIQRQGQTITVGVTPIDRRSVKLSNGTALPDTNPSLATAFIGISPATAYRTRAPWTAVPQVSAAMWHNSGSVIKSIGQVFSPSGLHTYYQNVTGTLPQSKVQSAQETRFVSPVGLVSYAHDAARDGWLSTLSLLYAINLFVGIFNMTPLLPFDGGHVAIALYEKVRSIGRNRYYTADFNKMLPLSYAVLAVLVVLSLSSLWLDIVNPEPNPFQ